MKKSQHIYSFLEAKQKIESWCAYQERAQSEVLSKLQSYGLDYEDAETLLADLILNNFVNERRFCEAFVSGKINIKRWGRRKIYLELQRKKVPKSIIQEVFREIDEDAYLANLKALGERKYRESKGNAYEKKAKTWRFLESKGYETELIAEFFKGEA